MDLGKLPQEERIRLTTVTTSRVLLSTLFPHVHAWVAIWFT